MKVKATIAGFTNELTLFDLFIVKIDFTKPTITPHPIPFKIKDVKKSVVIDKFSIAKDPTSAPVDLSLETLTYAFSLRNYNAIPAGFLIQLDQTTPAVGKIGSLTIESVTNDHYF